MIASFTIGKQKKRGALNLAHVRHSSEVIRLNAKTVIVRAPDGSLVKRHKVKHRVILEEG